jgi:hypothetical protein
MSKKTIDWKIYVVHRTESYLFIEVNTNKLLKKSKPSQIDGQGIGRATS